MILPSIPLGEAVEGWLCQHAGVVYLRRSVRENEAYNRRKAYCEASVCSLRPEPGACGPVSVGGAP